EPLREAYLRYIDAINMFEARDLTPDRLLKPGDFHKLFFDSNESFAASVVNRAMPWPPVITKPNNQRVLGAANTRLIDTRKIGTVLAEQFQNHVAQTNPFNTPPAFDGLFKNAEKPILFWRTAKRDPSPLPPEFSGIETALKKKAEDWQ